MNAAETIAKAIEKLEGLQAEAVYVAPWRRDTSWVIDGDGDYITENVGRDTAELIEVLHRTIDAQIAILKAASVRLTPRFGEYVIAAEALALANAILGGDQ